MRIGTYIWTANAAGWAAIAYLTGVEAAWIVAAGCACMAYLWSITFDDNGT